MLNEYLASSDHLILLHLLNTTVEIITENRLEKAANVSPSTHVKSDVSLYQLIVKFEFNYLFGRTGGFNVEQC